MTTPTNDLNPSWFLPILPLYFTLAPATVRLQPSPYPLQSCVIHRLLDLEVMNSLLPVVEPRGIDSTRRLPQLEVVRSRLPQVGVIDAGLPPLWVIRVQRVRTIRSRLTQGWLVFDVCLPQVRVIKWSIITAREGDQLGDCLPRVGKIKFGSDCHE